MSQEGRLSSIGQTVPLEGDEWKSCRNKRSNRPLAYWPEGKGLVTPLLEKDWDISDLCTATLCEENAHLQAAVRARASLSQVWAAVHLVAAV